MRTQKNKTKTITVRVWRGIVSDVKNIPPGIRVRIIDEDSLDGKKAHIGTIWIGGKK